MSFEAVLAPWLLASPAAPAPMMSVSLYASLPTTTSTAGCPSGMVRIKGTHWENVQRLCTSFHHDKCWSYFPFAMAFEGRATNVDACMDVYEWPNQKGVDPHVMMRFSEAESSCASIGKRLCTEFEWELACEGPETMPWPYGWSQKKGVCNNDKPYRAISESKIHSSSQAVRDAETRRLWQGEPAGAFPECVSPLGVVDIVGNVEEWVTTSRPEWPYRSSLKGGYWSKPWSGCRGTNERHGPSFRFYEIGFRCCSDPSQ